MYVPRQDERIKTQEEKRICHENFKNNKTGFMGGNERSE